MLIVKSHHVTRHLDSSPKRQMRQLAFLLFGTLTLHTAAMMAFESLIFIDAIWLTMTTAATVGYGDLAPKTLEGRLLTILLIYLGGILMLARIGGLYFDFLLERRMKIIRGKWQWKTKNHLVFINAPQEGAINFFIGATQDLRNSVSDLSEVPIVIYSNQFEDGLPESLREMGVGHVHNETVTEESLKNAAVADASIIVVLTKNIYDPASDSIAFDMVHRLRAMGVKGRLIVESIHPENKTRLLAAGADVVLRPIRSYPELIVRAILAPGSEMIIEELISHKGATCRRYDISLTAHWRELCQLFNDKNWGILIGYIGEDDQQHIGGHMEQNVSTKGLLAIVREDETPAASIVVEELRKLYKKNSL